MCTSPFMCTHLLILTLGIIRCRKLTFQDIKILLRTQLSTNTYTQMNLKSNLKLYA